MVKLKIRISRTDRGESDKFQEDENSNNIEIYAYKNKMRLYKSMIQTKQIEDHRRQCKTGKEKK